ncbi:MULTISPECIES: guanylate kinase [unclassified Wenzhouxiangella]|uniref:guanylate kinase n=1 Tax=unclassified Wenzhouxiangella TaxID=2613841 RepID=UPI000E32A9CC|nr:MULTISPECIES: guanylate kinase [unclassified Wenzhouxiangella]RFF27308.1 guanylate kinase [Wenzhouxiangella sp. 15181]RFP68741.1 guanylate kinase [Wenzhouxiangella sp. 15190]
MSSDPHVAGELFLIAAPSGAGKTSLIRALLEQCPNLALSVSDTTRPARSGEVDGEQYHFVSVEEFGRGIEAGDYLEHAEVFGNYYGTRRDRVEGLRDAGRDVLLEIDVQGAAQILRSHPDVCTIFILPPSMAELAERLRQRGSDTPEVIERRLGEARREIAACGDFRWMVVNDEFEQALADLQAIVRSWPLRRQRKQDLVDRLLDESAADGTITD